MKFVFLHGGPGFNGMAEQAILGPIFESLGHETTFWNEPSSLRPRGEPFVADGAFERWLASAEQCVVGSAGSGPVHVMAHSFTVQGCMEIARRHAPHVSTLVMIAPAADPFGTYRNVLKLAREDLHDTKPDIAAAIGDSLEHTRAVLDKAMHAGMLNVLQDERLFTHYWANPGQMQASMTAREGPEGQFDVDSFFAVLSDFAQRGATLLSTAPVNVPTLGTCSVGTIESRRQTSNARRFRRPSRARASRSSTAVAITYTWIGRRSSWTESSAGHETASNAPSPYFCTRGVMLTIPRRPFRRKGGCALRHAR